MPVLVTPRHVFDVAAICRERLTEHSPTSTLEARTLPDLARYLVRCDGLIVRVERQKRAVVAARLNDEGYPKVKLTDDHGRRREYFVHRLVAMAFLPPRKEAQRYVLHGPDRDRTNCWWWNLRWGTHYDNHQDKLADGTMPRPTRKLLPKDVRRIRQSSLGAAKLARKMGLSVSHVREVRNGRKWSRQPGARRKAA